MRVILLALIALVFVLGSADAQPVADTLFTWRGIGREGRCRVRIYQTPDDEERTHVVVLQELAENDGPTVLDDVSYLAELVGRANGIAPEEAYWIVNWGAFSYEGASPKPVKELFLRATFRRNKSGSLGSPSWRVITREEVEAYTDRLFR